MERASRALERMDYFLAERLAWDSLCRAHAAADFDRMSRIILPLLEARRQKRQLATDVVHLTGGVPIIADPAFIDNDPPVPGCFLFQPPVIAAEARIYRDAADAGDIPTLILTREPMTRDGLWPIVSVGLTTLRTKVVPPYAPASPSPSSSSPPPPWPAARQGTGITRDDVRPETHIIPLPWFEAAAEQLGDAALARLEPSEPAAWHVDDLMEFLEAFPDHEKLHQRLEEACLRAGRDNLPEEQRHRPEGDPFG